MADTTNSGTVDTTGAEVVHLKPKESYQLDGLSYEDSKIEIVGADLVVINPETGEKTIFPGLALFLFDDEQAPTISMNGQLITPKMFGDKLGVISNVAINDYVSYTSLDVSEEKPEEQKSLPENNKDEQIEKLQEENQELKEQAKEAEEKISKITETNEEAEFLLATLSSDNAQLQAESLEADKPPEDEPREFPEAITSGAPPEEPNYFVSNEDSSSVSSSNATETETETETETSTEEIVATSVATFSFQAFALQPAASEAMEDVMGTPTFTVRGGGGNADSTFNPDNTVQLSAEILNYSSRTDDIIVYADDADLFDDSNLTRSVEIVPTLPDGFELTSATITGLPAGFEIIGATGGGGTYDIDLTTATLSPRGTVQFNLKYPIPATQTFDMQISVTATFDTESGVTPAPVDGVQTFILTQTVEQKDVAGPLDMNYEDGSGNLVWVLTNQANQNTILSGSGDDVLNGSGGVDVINGAAGDDTIFGNDGDDTIDAGANDDTISGGLGDDDITGGTGIDTVDYSARTEDITLDMGTVDGDGYYTATLTGGETDMIRQVQNITGGSGNDSITGDGNNNILIGGDGDDVLDGALGDDTIDGGDGNDTISFISGGSGLTVNLGTGGVINVGTGNKTISNIESITATNFNDTITATGGDNVINGADGNDTFITDGSGNDTFDGGFNGVDSSATDLINYGSSANGITVDLNGAADGNGFFSVTVGATTDLIKNIEQIYGSNFAADNISGGAADEVLRGFFGDDTISGNGGDDQILGGEGSDVLDGGSGGEVAGDILNFSDLGAAVTLNLTTPSSGTAVSGGDTDTFSNFEQYVLTTYADTINTSSGVDTIDSGGGNDTFYASAGADVFDGGANSDTIDYTTRGAGVYIEVDLAAAPNLTVDVRNIGDDALIEQDIIDSIENVIGTAGNDTFLNGTANNSISGAGGTDTMDYSGGANSISFNMNLISGGFFDVNVTGGEVDELSSIERIIGSNANDTMQGDVNANIFLGDGGDDLFIATAGGDTYTGGAGNDQIRYNSVGGLNSVAVNLATGSAVLDLGAAGADAADETDTYTDAIERVTVTSGNDSVTGNGSNNVILDLGGDDVFDGGGGNNGINYSLLGGNGVIIDLTAGTADDDAGAGVLDTLTNFINATGSNQDDSITGDGANNFLNGGLGDDSIFGLDGNDILFGQNGNDEITGGNGDDDIDGGDGTDRVLYTGGSAVTVNLNTGSATDGNGDTDTLSNIEEVTGSSAGDTIIAGAETTEIDSGDGNDTITSNIHLGTAKVNNIDAGNNDDTIDYTATGAITGASINGNFANIGFSGSTDIVTNAERFRLGGGADQFSIDTNAIMTNLNEFDGNGGNDSITVTNGGAGNLSGAGIDGGTLAGIFSDIEAFDFTSTGITGPDQFDISDANVTAITGGGNTLNISIDGINMVLGDFNFQVGGGINNMDADVDPNIQHVIWNSGAEVIVSVI